MSKTQDAFHNWLAQQGPLDSVQFWHCWKAASELSTQRIAELEAKVERLARQVPEVSDYERFFAPEFEVWQGDEMVASASGPRDTALREAMHYAAEYEQDGPVRVFEVIRKLIAAGEVKP